MAPLILLIIIIPFTGLLAIALYFLFRRHNKKLTSVYLILIVLFLLNHLFSRGQLFFSETEIIPFNNNQELNLTFTPNNDLKFTIDIIFENQSLIELFNNCNFGFNRFKEFDKSLCPTLIIYKKISGLVNDEPLLAKLEYKKDKGGYFPYGLEGTHYGSLNNYLFFEQSGLHIMNFKAIKNTPVTIKLKIHADQESIINAKPILVVAPHDDVGNSSLFLFLIIAIPFILAILMTWIPIVFRLLLKK